MCPNTSSASSVLCVEAALKEWTQSPRKSFRPSRERLAAQIKESFDTVWEAEEEFEDCSYWMFIKSGDQPCGSFPTVQRRNAIDIGEVRPVLDKEHPSLTLEVLQTGRTSRCGFGNFLRRVWVLGIATAGAVAVAVRA